MPYLARKVDRFDCHPVPTQRGHYSKKAQRHAMAWEQLGNYYSLVHEQIVVVVDLPFRAKTWRLWKHARPRTNNPGLQILVPRVYVGFPGKGSQSCWERVVSIDAFAKAIAQCHWMLLPQHCGWNYSIVCACLVAAEAVIPSPGSSSTKMSILGQVHLPTMIPRCWIGQIQSCRVCLASQAIPHNCWKYCCWELPKRKHSSHCVALDSLVEELDW